MYAWLERLNEQQREAVVHDGGPLRVLAGAGTGKTTTLSTRVAWLVSEGVPAERVLLLTFTRRAAREMITRADQLVGRSSTRGTRVMGGTFHSVAHRILRTNAAALGLSDGFSIIDSADAADLIDLARTDVMPSATAKRFPRKATLLDLYSRTVNTATPLPEVVEREAPWCRDHVEPIGEICRRYVSSKRARALLDFDDLLLYWRAALRHERIGPGIATAFDHILVDEYQDVNALQVDIVAGLRSTDPRVTVVGDDAQAVYGFRGADPRHLLEVEQVFPDLTTIHLGQNYRSTQPILDVANALSDDAPRGFGVRLHSRAVTGESPTLITCGDEDAEVRAVCERVLSHREAGTALRDQAVLVRASHHSDLLELELSRRGIPYVKYGGLRFLEAAHVKDLLCAFRLADNPRDELAWFRLLQRLDGVGPATARRAIAALGLDEGGTDADVPIRWMLAASELPTKVLPLADGLVSALTSREGESIGAHAARIAEAYRPILDAAFDDPLPRSADLDALVAAAQEAVRLSETAAEVTLEPPRSTSELAGAPLVDEDWLVISTVHSAKGLEWDVVHLLHAADGNFPSDMALGDADGLEEERRLFYVATTRARRALHVYFPQRFHFQPRRNDEHCWGQPSRFLSQAVRACFTEEVAAVDADEPLVRFHPGDVADTVGLELDDLWA